MSRIVVRRCSVWFSALGLGAMLAAPGSVDAGLFNRRARRAAVSASERPVLRPTSATIVAPRAAVEPEPAPLGRFYPMPTIWVRGNDPVGGGYSPLGIYGQQTMSLYGPFSPFRPATAPIVVYTRGYDGVTRPTEAISSSYPNLPALAPVAYPTRSNNFYAPRTPGLEGPQSAIDWLDQN